MSLSCDALDVVYVVLTGLGLADHSSAACLGTMGTYGCKISHFFQHHTSMRHEYTELWFASDMFGDIALGLYLVRGDALVLMGELDASLEETPRLKKVSADEILEAQKEFSVEERQEAKLDWLFQDLS